MSRLRTLVPKASPGCDAAHGARPMQRGQSNATAEEEARTSLRAIDALHPAIRNWFSGRFAAPTPCQIEAWPAILEGRHALIAVPRDQALADVLAPSNEDGG